MNKTLGQHPNISSRSESQTKVGSPRNSSKHSILKGAAWSTQYSFSPFVRTQRLSGQIARNSRAILNYPPAQNQYMQEKFLEELIFVRMHVGPVFALAQIQEDLFQELFLKHVCAPSPLPLYHNGYSSCIHTPLMPTHEYILGEFFGANTCSACIRTRRTQENIPGDLICALVSCQGVLLSHPN